MSARSVPGACGHLLCDLIGGPCSIVSGRSRGCAPGRAPKTVAPEVFDEVRALLAVIEPVIAAGARDPAAHDERVGAAAVRLAEIVHREARDDRNPLALARTDEPELAPALSALCVRRRP